MNQSVSKCAVPPALSCSAAVLALLAFILSGFAAAHHPDWENQRVTPYIDLIGPMGNRLPPGYRRKYNRPTYLGGKVMYWIAPSSQEAMAWHHASHSGAYQHDKKHQRYERHYFYPKPWEMLKIGARRSKMQQSESTDSYPDGMIEDLETEPLESIERDPSTGLDSLLAPPEAKLELPDLELSDVSREAESPSDAVK